MGIWISDARVKISNGKDGKENLEIFEKYSTARVSSSRKDRDSDKYLYSDWYVRFLGKAHEFVSGNVRDGDLVVLNKAIITKEAYTNKDGERVFPKNPTVLVFECSKFNSKNSGSSSVEVPPEDDIPF